MKVTGERWTIGDKFQLNAFTEWVQKKWLEGRTPTVQVMGPARSGAQNSLIYSMYGEIQRHLRDVTVQEVRRQCKLYYGVPIRRAHDPDFCSMYDRLIKERFNTEEKLELMDQLDITSEFTKEQAGEYIDTIIISYREKGIILHNPKDAA